MKRVRAFTLAEMIIALLLTVIIISAAFAGYVMVSKSAHKIMTQTNYFSDILKVDQIFRNRSQQSNDIIYLDSTFLFNNRKSNDRIRDADSSLIYSSASIVDSFSLNASLNPILLQDTGLNIKEGIREIYFTIYSGDSEIVFHYTKTYAADYFMNYSKD